VNPARDRRFFPATRLTQGHRRVVKGKPIDMPAQPAARPPAVCRVCGVSVEAGRRYCAKCAITVSKDNLIEVTKLGRVAGHGPEARAHQSEKQRRRAAEFKAWKPSDKPEWLTEEFIRQEIQPHLSRIRIPAIASALRLSVPYAAQFRAGRQRPHPRHWQTLAIIVGFS